MSGHRDEMNEQLLHSSPMLIFVENQSLTSYIEAEPYSVLPALKKKMSFTLLVETGQMLWCLWNQDHRNNLLKGMELLVQICKECITENTSFDHNYTSFMAESISKPTQRR